MAESDGLVPGGSEGGDFDLLAASLRATSADLNTSGESRRIQARWLESGSPELAGGTITASRA